MGEDAIWWASGRKLDPEHVGIFAHGMRHVAFADGHLNVRELTLIASFESALGARETTGSRLPGDLEEAYVQALLLVAFADGGMTRSERWMIEHLLEEQGIAPSILATHEERVKKLFVDQFAGRSLFRAAVVRVAEDLGMSGEALSALRAEA
jgi:uncharacterized tellurite resistance protein B-like protein